MQRALDLLQHVFGYNAFRGEQAAIVQTLSAGGDALVLMPTGGGKSLCFQLPALLRTGVAIVVSPLIALMHDQVAALRESGVRCAFLNSSLTPEAARTVLKALDDGQLDLLYVAPERLLTNAFLSRLDARYEAADIALFAIDEAHCVSQWGHDFRPEYLQLSILPQRYAGVPRIALTATADQDTRQEIAHRLHLQQARHFIASFDRPNIHYTIVEKNQPRQQLLDFLTPFASQDAGIIYCATRARVETTAAWLCQQGFQALPYHAGLSNELRNENQRRFLQESGIIIVATIAFGMGIDKPDVRFVAHLDLPRSIENYYQETGRAGRDGMPAQAWMCWGSADAAQQRRYIEQSEANEVFKNHARQRLEQLIALVQTPLCRRQHILACFDEQAAPCGNCDNCLHPPQTWNATEAARKALSCVWRTGQAHGMNYLIDVLRGQHNDRVLERGHDRISTFGIGADLSVSQWRQVFRQLLASGMLAANQAQHGTLCLQECARPLLRGEGDFQLRVQRLEAGSARRARKNRAAPLPTGLPTTLFDRLRLWRSEMAKTKNVPAYVIFLDNTLREIALRRPTSLAELAQIAGIGEQKLQRYGQTLLALVKDQATPAD